MKKLIVLLLLCSPVFGIPNDLDTINWRGCSNGDGVVNISDVIYTSEFLFNNGPYPVCYDAADANKDGTVDITDVIVLTNFLFNGGPQGYMLEQVDC
jgi:hypothetical protein